MIAENPKAIRILGIDPGTHKLGLSILDLDIETGELVLVHACTLDGHKNAKIDPELSEIHGHRVGRLMAHYMTLSRIFNQCVPTFVVSESPFLGGHAQAYAALVECIVYIRFALYEHQPDLALMLIDPPTVKMAVKVKGNADKDEVKRGLIAMDCFTIAPHLQLALLDEHSIDAIAVGLTQALSLKERFR